MPPVPDDRSGPTVPLVRLLLRGLASGPTAYPWQAHARGLVAHLVLGATTDAVLGAADRIR